MDNAWLSLHFCMFISQPFQLTLGVHAILNTNRYSDWFNKVNMVQSKSFYCLPVSSTKLSTLSLIFISLENQTYIIL